MRLSVLDGVKGDVSFKSVASCVLETDHGFQNKVLQLPGIFTEIVSDDQIVSRCRREPESDP